MKPPQQFEMKEISVESMKWARSPFSFSLLCLVIGPEYLCYALNQSDIIYVIYIILQFRQFVCFYSELTMAPCDIFLCSVWPERLTVTNFELMFDVLFIIITIMLEELVEENIIAGAL